MNLIKRVEITGFWGNRDFLIDFHKDINFLVGVNGSGKTTLINLIAASLNADFPTLDRLPFQSIRIVLSRVGGRNNPVIEIKKIHKKSPYPGITYSIKEKVSDKPNVYSLDEIEEALMFRASPPEYAHPYPRSRRIRMVHNSIIDNLRHLVNVTWLSIHRTASKTREERSFESTVDEKLAELSNNFVKFFSLLSKLENKETSKFQQTIFLSLLSRDTESGLISSIKNLDLEKEKKELVEIFKLFNLDENITSRSIESHFKLYSDALDKYESKEGLSFKYFNALLGTLRLHSIVQERIKLIDKLKEIYKPRDTFLDIINGLMKGKTLKINDKNEIEAFTLSGQQLSLKNLSSGEKQLLILLGETLIQEEKPWIYIADEPELSLHVRWQEQLINNVRRINPNAQIIVATHSPDVVGNYSSRLIDIEKIIE